jgi:hypothetical protein
MSEYGVDKWTSSFPKHRSGAAVEANRPLIFRSAAEVIGCLVAPVPIVVVGVAESILYTSFDAVTVVVFLFIAYMAALGFVILLGYPLYRLLMRLKIFSWWTSILLGFFIGAIVTIIISQSVNAMSNGVLVNSLAASVSGLLFWIFQRVGSER